MRWRRLAVVVLVLMTADMAASVMIDCSARGRLYSDLSHVPYRRVGLVLGCSPTAGQHYINPYFTNRIKAAADLYTARKVDYLIVSGDNHTASYDEPTAMKVSLIAAGVPAERIVCDYAGFHTLDSVVRARKVFGQTRITVVSQKFHNERAIFLARHHGIDAIGFDAAEVSSKYSLRTDCREQVSKVASVFDVYVVHRKPKFLGPMVAVE